MTKKTNTDKPTGEDHTRPVTLRDIARELGISHVTVSLALRDHPRISKATRTRVKQQAEAMGYHPDPMLSALSHYRLTSREKPVQATMAWLNPLKNPEKLLKLDEFASYWKGAEALAKKLGFHLEEFRTAELPLKRMDSIFKTRSIRGLILVPFAHPIMPLNWNDITWADYAAVRLGRSPDGPQLHCITSAQVSDAIQAFRKTHEKGYKRIGFIGDLSARRMFISGYLRAQLSVPINRRIPLLMYGAGSNALQHDILDEWLRKNRPDAIITDNDHVLTLLQELKLQVPEDVGLATMSIQDTPIDAGIDQNPLEIGRAAVRTLDSLLNEHQFGIPDIRNQILVEGCWVDGPMLPDRN